MHSRTVHYSMIIHELLILYYKLKPIKLYYSMSLQEFKACSSHYKLDYSLSLQKFKACSYPV